MEVKCHASIFGKDVYSALRGVNRTLQNRLFEEGIKTQPEKNVKKNHKLANF